LSVAELRAVTPYALWRAAAVRRRRVLARSATQRRAVRRALATLWRLRARATGGVLAQRTRAAALLLACAVAPIQIRVDWLARPL
jgi:hypothetical protein